MNNGRLPPGWRIEFLGLKRKSGTHLCQLKRDNAKPGEEWFISQIGRDDNEAFENAARKAEQYAADYA